MGYTTIDTGHKGKHGQCSLATQNGKLIVVFPRACFGGKQKTMSLGLTDTKDNRQIALSKLNAIQNDINLGQFDPTLERYKPQIKQATYQSRVNELNPTITLIDIWEKYLNYKRPLLKITTVDYLETTITPHLIKSGIISPYKALELREYLLKNTTQSMAKRVLTYVNAAMNWGKSHSLIKHNPYQGMAKQLKHKYEIETEPKAFSAQEKEQILKAFQTSDYCHYINFVKFLFMTGCRPSEAIGLKWSDIQDLKKIYFRGSIQKLSTGEFVEMIGSKNNRKRVFPCNADLENFLKNIPFNKDSLIFLSQDGKTIDYDNFRDHVWKKIVDPIKPDTTPYSCRDTFITEQILKGVNPSIIAKWVDTSTSMIDRYYLDPVKLTEFVPQ